MMIVLYTYKSLLIFDSVFNSDKDIHLAGLTPLGVEICSIIYHKTLFKMLKKFQRKFKV